MRNSLIKVSEESSSPTNLYLKDDCWEHIFRLLRNNDLKSLSLVSKMFLSITNRLRFSLTLRNSNLPFISNYFRRFTNLTSVNFPPFCDDLDTLLPQISRFPSKITSLNLSKQLWFPVNGLRAFSQSITTLTSLSCSNLAYVDHTYQFFLIAHCFPFLQILDLSNTKCSKVNHLLRAERKLEAAVNLSAEFPNLDVLNLSFKFPKLEVLNLSFTTIDDDQFYVISKACSGLLQLLLKNCPYVTEKGVKHVLQNCTHLRDIDIRRCPQVHPKIVPSMILSRPSLRKIRAPRGYIMSDTEKKLFGLQGCIVC